MITVDWEAGADTLWDGIANFEQATKDGIRAIMEAFVPRMIDYAKVNAPWDDRTGAARDGLDAKFIQTSNTMGISLFHTVDYGVWLEIRWGGYYAIILPTIETLGPELMDELDGLLDNITYYEGSITSRLKGVFSKILAKFKGLR